MRGDLVRRLRSLKDDKSNLETQFGSEAVGKLISVSKETLTLSCERQYSFRIDPSELAKWRPRLRRGSTLGILFLGEGKIRVRLLQSHHRKPATAEERDKLLG